MLTDWWEWCPSPHSLKGGWSLFFSSSLVFLVLHFFVALYTSGVALSLRQVIFTWRPFLHYLIATSSPSSRLSPFLCDFIFLFLIRGPCTLHSLSSTDFSFVATFTSTCWDMVSVCVQDNDCTLDAKYVNSPSCSMDDMLIRSVFIPPLAPWIFSWSLIVVRF